MKDVIATYWNSRSHSYDNSPGHGYNTEEEKRAWAKELLGALGSKTPQNILDVGTGTGAIALLLAEAGHNVTGVDISERMLDVARKKAEARTLRVRFEIADAEKLPFDDSTFDAVVCRHLLWTLPTPNRALKEWMRVAVPSGRIVIIDGRHSAPGPAARIKGLIGQIGIAFLERRNPFNFYKNSLKNKLPFADGAGPEELNAFMSSHGLEDITIRDLNYIRELQKKSMPWYYRIAASYQTSLVSGEVPVAKGQGF